MTPNKEAAERTAPARKIIRVYDAWMGFWFGEADSRVYAAFRIAFSCAALVSLLDLWSERHTVLSQDGMIDHTTVMNAIGSRPYFSVFHYWNSPAEVTAIMVVSGIALICLALGVFARPAAILVYIWHVSFQYASFPAANGWDCMLSVYSMLLMISPLGLCWSLPVWLSSKPVPERVTSSPTTAPRYGLVLMRYQLILIYLSTFWSKVDDQYWRNGEFMSYFQMSIYANFPTAKWAEWSLLSAVMTYSALIVELAIPILLLRTATRWWAIGLGFALHGGIAVSTHLTIFSLVILSIYVTFLTREDIDWLLRSCRSVEFTRFHDLTKRVGPMKRLIRSLERSTARVTRKQIPEVSRDKKRKHTVKEKAGRTN